jgi:hypothetical protein
LSLISIQTILSFRKSDLVKFAAEIIPQILTGYDFFSASAADSQTSLIRHICPKNLAYESHPFWRVSLKSYLL